jgi:hypothetical protein
MTSLPVEYVRRGWCAVPIPRGQKLLVDRGKPLYRNFTDFKDRATRDRFTEQVINLVRREHPDIVGDEDDR